MSIVNMTELPNKISANDITKLIYKNVNGQNQELTEWQDGCEVDLKLFNITLNGSEGMIKLQLLQQNIGKKGDPCSDDILIVEGEGNINFTTRQTSL